MHDARGEVVTVKNTGFKSEEYPFRSNFFDLDGLKMHYLDEGKGFPVLMLHGNPTWSFYYRNLVKVLRENFRCIAPDHIGCGLSDKPQDYNYTLDTHINNILRLVSYLNIEKLNIVVHDWGGAIGMGLAVRRPDLINRVVIMNSAAFTDPFIPLRIAVCKIPVLGKFAVRRLNLFVQAARFMATTKRTGLTGEVLRGFLYPYGSFEERVAVYRFVKDIPMKPEHVSYSVLKGIEEKLKLLKDKEIIMIWGCKDFCFTTHFLERWKDFFPKAEDLRLEQAGHYVLEDGKDEVIMKISEFFSK